MARNNALGLLVADGYDKATGREARAAYRSRLVVFNVG